MELKNQVIWTTRCKVMTEYISIYFDIFQYILIYFSWITLDDIKEHQKQKKIRQGFALDLWPLF